MASSSYTIQQQQASIEARIKTLINNDLKEICKAYGYQVSGTKAVLQKRCTEIIQTVLSKNDSDAFHKLLYRVNHHGRSPPPVDFAASSSHAMQSKGDFGTYDQASSSLSRSMNTAVKSGSPGRYFKTNPFYEIIDTVLPLHELPEMPQNRHTVRANLTLVGDQGQRLRDDRSIRLLLYCGYTSSMSTHSPADVAFPNQIEVKINGDEIKGSFKGLKNKPGTTKPADITDKIRKNPGYQNQVSVTYALTVKRFAFTVYLARHITPETLMERIKTGRIIPKHKVLEEMNRANADPDIAATSVRMSLKDPVSTVRITLPVRSTVCTHNQCFDGSMFLQLQEQAPQWSCPVCSKSVPFESLCVDKYFEDILQKTSTAIEKVLIEPNGEWRVIKEEDDAQTNGSSSRKRARASYDDDFDDDNELVEVPDPSSRASNGVNTSHRFLPPAASPIGAPSFAFNTPPVSSREASVAQSTASAPRASSKRPASAVIDLTLSDEDDEPPRPAKRQSTSMIHGNNSQSYHAHAPSSSHRHSYLVHSGHANDHRPSSSSEHTARNSHRSSTAADQPTFTHGIVNSAHSPPQYQNTSHNGHSHSSISGAVAPFPPEQQYALSVTSASSRFEGSRFPTFSVKEAVRSDGGSGTVQPQQQRLQPQSPLLPPPPPPPPQYPQHPQQQQLQHLHHNEPNGLPRLPPMHPGPEHYDGWRNEARNYSSSP